jgi:hypothetical protein
MAKRPPLERANVAFRLWAEHGAVTFRDAALTESGIEVNDDQDLGAQTAVDKQPYEVPAIEQRVPVTGLLGGGGFSGY